MKSSDFGGIVSCFYRYMSMTSEGVKLRSPTTLCAASVHGIFHMIEALLGMH